MEASWKEILQSLRAHLSAASLPSVSQIARANSTPYHVLISTMISLRTKDEVTLAASERLFAVADNPATMARLSEQRIAELIYPAGFYRTKAVHLKAASRIIEERHGGKVPQDGELLTSLPGVGRKTANLVLGLGFGVPSICVDTHVHRIANRCGWVATRNPERTETELCRILPRQHWIEINELLVAYGQRVCTPVSPRCSECTIRGQCARIGVTRSR